MKPTRAGVIGWPIGHSLSPAMHNAAYRALGLDAEGWSYEANAIPPDILRQSIKEFMMHGYIGLNVTIPFKQAVLQYTRPDDIAKRVGAANTLVLPRNQATNTDVAGLIDDLQAHGLPLAEMKVLVLGAGGAARAAVYGLHEAGATLALLNRTPSKAFELLREMEISAQVKSHDEALLWQPDLIINTTAAGMQPDVHTSAWADGLPLPAGAVIYDMVYRPAKTKLMQQAESEGLRAIGGLGMLVRQGAKSFEIWTGREAPLDVMFEAVQKALEDKI